MFADRRGMAASSFLAAVAASVILLCFASESRESHCNGCMKGTDAPDRIGKAKQLIPNFRGTHSATGVAQRQTLFATGVLSEPSVHEIHHAQR